MHAHGTDGAEFLTAEAGDAPLAIDVGNAVLHGDDVRRTDLGTLFATDAAFLVRSRLGAQGGADKHGGKFSVPLKLQTPSDVDVIKIADAKRL